MCIHLDVKGENQHCLNCSEIFHITTTRVSDLQFLSRAKNQEVVLLDFLASVLCLSRSEETKFEIRIGLLFF
jgi:hypothetical protein